MNEDNKFGRELARAREAKGLTQSELGERIGVRQQSVAKWELGLTYPGKGNLKALYEVLGKFWQGGLAPRVYNLLSVGDLSVREFKPARLEAIEQLRAFEENISPPLRFSSEVALEMERALPPELVSNLNSVSARQYGLDYLSDRYAIEIKTAPPKPQIHTAQRIQAALWVLHTQVDQIAKTRTRCLLLVIEGFDHDPIMQKYIAGFVPGAVQNNIELYTASSGSAAANIIIRLESPQEEDEEAITEINQ